MSENVAFELVFEVSPLHRSIHGQTVSAVSDHNGSSVTFGTKCMKTPQVVTNTSEVTITLSLEEIDQLLEILQSQRDGVVKKREELKGASRIATVRPAQKSPSKPVANVSYG